VADGAAPVLGPQSGQHFFPKGAAFPLPGRAALAAIRGSRAAQGRAIALPGRRDGIVTARPGVVLSDISKHRHRPTLRKAESALRQQHSPLPILSLHA